MNKINIRGLEIIQSVQNLDNEMPLLQDKLTYIRFYPGSGANARLNSDVKLKVIAAQSTHYVGMEKQPGNTALSAVHHKSAASDINKCRLSWGKSLNFKLQQNFFTDNAIRCKNHVELAFELVDAINEESLFRTQKFEFKNVDLNLRVIAYRYTDVETGDVHEPAPGELSVIKGYIESAFPVSGLNWSTLTIDAPREFSRLQSVLERSERTDENIDKVYTCLFQHLLAIRNQDISFKPIGHQNEAEKNREVTSELWEANTLYLGVVKDPNNQIMGSAMDSPDFSTPHVVAVCGALPYGEVAAHELAHLLGRVHPGIPDRDIHGRLIGQKKQMQSECVCEPDDSTTQCSEYSLLGHLSKDNDKRLVGMDAQFKLNEPRLLPFNDYFDLMTYRYPKWVSACTYKGLLERIRELKNPETSESDDYYWNVIGEYNLIKKTAKINYVLHSRFSIPKPDQTSKKLYDNDFIGKLFKLEIRYALNEVDCKSAPESVYLRRNLEYSDNSKFVGVFQHTINTLSSQPPSQIILLINGNAVDVYSQGTDTPGVRRIFDSLAGNSRSAADNSGQVPAGPGVHKSKSKLSFKYSVDKAGFYLKFDWPIHHLVAPHESSDQAPAADMADPVDSKDMYKYPVTTTVQFKFNEKAHANKNRFSRYKTQTCNRWQTVAITNRLREEVWISPELTVLLTTRDGSEDYLYSSISTVKNISDLNRTFFELGIRFRVCISVQGVGQVIYDSKLHDPDKKLLKDRTVLIEAFGSKGPNARNYYRQYSIGKNTKCNEKQYYRPNVLDHET